MDPKEIAAMDFRKPETGSFTADNWPTDAQYALGSETKDGWKIVGCHETIVGLWYHVEPTIPDAKLPDEDHPGLIHMDLLVPKDSPRVLNDDEKARSAYNFEKTGESGDAQEKETEVNL